MLGHEAAADYVALEEVQRLVGTATAELTRLIAAVDQPIGAPEGHLFHVFARAFAFGLGLGLGLRLGFGAPQCHMSIWDSRLGRVYSRGQESRMRGWGFTCKGPWLAQAGAVAEATDWMPIRTSGYSEYLCTWPG
jgi:hypothetical protein